MKHLPYPEYKDSGIESLGKVPADWDVVAVSRFVNFGNGADYKHVEVADGGYPVIGSGGEFRRASEYLFDGESVLFGRKGTVDKPLYVTGKFWTVDTMYYTEIDTRHLVPKFLYYWALRLPFDFYLTNTALPSMTQTDLGSARIALPDPVLQKKIVQFLDDETAEIDAFIADQERLIELLEERRAATIAQAVTKGLDPDVAMKDSGINWLGNVPEDWAISPLKWVSQLVTGTTPSTAVEGHYTEDVDGFPWIRPEDINESGRPTVASQRLSSTGRHLVRILPPKAVLLVCIGTVGKVGITADKASTNQQITAIYGKGIDSKYLFFTMQVAYPEIRLAATGTTLPILNSSRLGSIRVPLPSEKEQQIISTYLERETSAIDAAVSDAREAIALSQERRAALISAAVTGQVDVTQAQRPVDEVWEEGVRV